MNKLGVVTIGEAPRSDITPILEKYLGEKMEFIQAGVLDGMPLSQIESTLAPVQGEYTLTSRLRSGTSVVMSREKITPIVQEKINELEARECTIILLLCTGVFHGLTTKHAFLIEPERIIPPTVAKIVKNRTLGIIGPLAKQEQILLEKWGAFGIRPLYASASPYQYKAEQFIQAAKELQSKGADLILLDCMGYVEEMKDIVKQQVGIMPVILSNVMIAKILSELG